MTEQSVRVAGAPDRLSGSLGVPSIVFMVVAAAAPLTVIAGVVPVGLIIGNGVGFPSMFALAAVILIFFAVGFTAMTRSVPKPGAFFTYIAHGLGRPSGLAGAYLALLCYMAVEVAVFGYIGVTIRDGIDRIGGPVLPWWLYAFAVVALVGTLGYRHIELSSKVLAVLLVLEISIVLLLSLIIVVKGGGDGLSLAPFSPHNVSSGSPAIGLMFAIAGFIGFEATAIFRDEARDPNRTIPRATYAAVLLIGVFYAISSWAIVMAVGTKNVVAEASKNPTGFVIQIARDNLGVVGEVAINIFLITSIFAAALSFHNVIARYVHTLSGSGLLPSPLAGVHGKHNAPSNASLATSAVAATLLFLGLVLGLDPYAKIFTWFVGLASLAIIILMAVTSLAVIVYFKRVGGAPVWNALVAPGIGLIGLLYAAVITTKNFPLLVGDVDAKGTPVLGSVALGLLALVVVVVIIGYVQALFLRSRGSTSYDRIVEALT